MSSDASALSQTGSTLEHSCVTCCDRISQLPNDVLCKIISHFTIREGVKTSALSPSWKGLWKSKNDFVLDWINIFGTDKNSDYWKTCENPCLAYKDKFVMAVNQLLTSYQGSQTVSFKISFCLGHKYASDIDQWVSFAIRMGAETLWVKLECDKLCSGYCCDYNLDRNDDKYVFSRDVFHGMKNNVRDLFLMGCKLGPNLGIEFSSLETLVLYYSPLASYDLQALFAYMGNLARLTLTACGLPTRLCFASLLKLKSLAITWCRGLEEINLSNLNLVYLEYVSLDMITLNFQGAPNLITFGSGGDGLNLNYLFTCLPLYSTVTDLTLITEINWVAEMPNSALVFSNIRQLKLVFTAQMPYDVSKMISILRAFPSLQKLYLGTNCQEDSEQEIPTSLELCQVVHQHQQLEEVEICGLHATRGQIQLVIYLLEHATALKRLVIRYKIEVYLGNSFGFIEDRRCWDKGEFEKIWEGLRGFFKDFVVIEY